ncbi:hypothetical protein Tco_0840880 [Tanacetum coccineum]|uniref:Uncharacterized protein n=1 Tax=Tanacetum coccineum TaxID=301880 RepID=A0ABQ5AYC5_9ASTR
MFGLLKELTTSRTPEMVLVREEARHPVTKYVNAISLVKIEKEKNIENNKVVDKNVLELSELNAIEPKEEVDMKKEVGGKTKSQLGVEEGTECDIDPVAPTTTVSRLILEWEERIKLHKEKELEFNQWRSKVFNNERSTFVDEGCEVCYINVFWPYGGPIDDLEVFGLRLKVDLGTVSRSWLIVGVFYLVDFSFDLLLTVSS